VREAKEGAMPNTSRRVENSASSGVNSETDFVARNDIFHAFCDDAAKRYATESHPDLEAERQALVAKIVRTSKLPATRA